MGCRSTHSVAFWQRPIDHVAHETESGTEPTQHAVSGGRFGVQMPIIDAGRPENSYLMYKVLISRRLNQELDSIADRQDSFAVEPLSSAQIEAARAWFIGFGAMPPDEVGYPRRSLGASVGADA